MKVLSAVHRRGRVGLSADILCSSAKSPDLERGTATPMGDRRRDLWTNKTVFAWKFCCPGQPRRADTLSCKTSGDYPTWIPGTSPIGAKIRLGEGWHGGFVGAVVRGVGATGF